MQHAHNLQHRVEVMAFCEWDYREPEVLQCIHCSRKIFTSSRQVRTFCPVNPGNRPVMVAAEQPGLDGPGSHLKAMLAGWPFYITAVPGCPCNEHAAKMDAWGPDGCEQRIDEIVEWLQLEATRRGLPFSAFAAKLLVRRAIAKARRARPPS